MKTKTNKKQPPSLPSWLFWDTDPDTIDWEKNDRYVIERVITRGFLRDWNEIKRYYGINRIKIEIVSMRFLDKLTHNFFSIYFDIPKEKFRCYTMKQYFPGHWDY